MWFPSSNHALAFSYKHNISLVHWRERKGESVKGVKKPRNPKIEKDFKVIKRPKGRKRRRNNGGENLQGGGSCSGCDEKVGGNPQEFWASRIYACRESKWTEERSLFQTLWETIYTAATSFYVLGLLLSSVLFLT